MLLQSALGVVRVFANWPKHRNACFTRLRAYGAFLVSARQTEGVVQSVDVISERGQPLILVNPWPGQAVRVSRSQGAASVVQGERFTLQTRPGETLTLVRLPG
jgi:hypothetical protein